MVKGKHKTGRYRRLNVKTSSGNSLKYKVKKSNVAKCMNCNQTLFGVLNAKQVHHAKFSKTLKVPSRPFGGNLCSACTRDLFTNTVKLMVDKNG